MDICTGGSIIDGWDIGVDVVNSHSLSPLFDIGEGKGGPESSLDGFHSWKSGPLCGVLDGLADIINGVPPKHRAKGFIVIFLG